MKFLHTADWHIGKKLHGFSLLNEQKEVFEQLLTVAQKEKVDAIVIAGDLYDRSVPPAEAVRLLNEMFYQLNIQHKFPILSISGNHDSATRLETGTPWYQEMNFHLQTTLNKALFEGIKLKDVQFFLLPYFEPVDARIFFEDETLKTHDEAVQRTIEEMKKNFDPSFKQVLVSHFFVAGSQRTDSETEVTVGGLDNVSSHHFKDFHYVALGHLHHPNASKHPLIQYSGSLLKYSTSEAKQDKGFRLIDIAKDGAVQNQFVSVHPSKDLLVLENDFSTLLDPQYYQTIKKDQYIFARLTDTRMIPNAMDRLREVYPNIIGMERLNRAGLMNHIQQLKHKDQQLLAPDKLFAVFYEGVTGKTLSQKQEEIVTETMESIQKEEE